MRAAAAEATLPAKIPPLSPRMEITPLPPPKPAPPPRKWTEQYKDLLPVTLEALKDENPQIRVNSFRILMDLGREAVPALVETLKGKDTELRAWAALILGNLGAEAKGALPTLLTIVKDKNENNVLRSLASRAITHIVENAP
jgi:HEAT repeat protein